MVSRKKTVRKSVLANRGRALDLSRWITDQIIRRTTCGHRANDGVWSVRQQTRDQQNSCLEEEKISAEKEHFVFLLGLVPTRGQTIKQWNTSDADSEATEIYDPQEYIKRGVRKVESQPDDTALLKKCMVALQRLNPLTILINSIPLKKCTVALRRIDRTPPNRTSSRPRRPKKLTCCGLCTHDTLWTCLHQFRIYRTTYSKQTVVICV